MNLVKKTAFGEVEAIRLGFGPLGPPLMSVFLYVVDGLVIDTGQHNMQKVVVELLKAKKLDQILLTHHHEDHSGNAFALGKGHQIAVSAHSLTVEKMRYGFKILPYQHYVWGKTDAVEATPFESAIETDCFKFKPIHTPGHSKDHTVYLEEENGWLFSGDLYLADRIKYFRADERLNDQIHSLKRVLEFDFEVLFCAHNPCLENGRSRLKNKLQFLEDLYGNIHLLIQKGFSEREVIKKLDPKNDRLVRWITMGNVSFANMVRSAMHATT
jgi:glyoxylase-like metal-dependent hydrolase (beta-lactamase superfamily II)